MNGFSPEMGAHRSHMRHVWTLGGTGAAWGGSGGAGGSKRPAGSARTCEKPARGACADRDLVLNQHSHPAVKIHLVHERFLQITDSFTASPVVALYIQTPLGGMITCGWCGVDGTYPHFLVSSGWVQLPAHTPRVLSLVGTCVLRPAVQLPPLSDGGRDTASALW